MIVCARNKNELNDRWTLMGGAIGSSTYISPSTLYTVHAIALFDGKILLQVVDDIGMPSLLDSALFHVLDPSLPHDWIANTRTVEPRLVIGPVFFAKDLESYQRVAELEPSAVQQFWTRVKSMSPDGLQSPGLTIELTKTADDSPSIISFRFEAKSCTVSLSGRVEVQSLLDAFTKFDRFPTNLEDRRCSEFSVSLIGADMVPVRMKVWNAGTSGHGIFEATLPVESLDEERRYGNSHFAFEPSSLDRFFKDLLSAVQAGVGQARLSALLAGR